ncbi:MAG: cysteine--tRNA ligase [Nitrospiraceae bacterium]
MKIHNTLTGTKDFFESLEPNTIKMYVCGVTVYDYCHIGHARSALIFDILRRYFEHLGWVVEFVKNFTDVDDKIIRRANDEGVACSEITEKYIAAYREDMRRLGIRPAWREPKATEHMDDIIRLIDVLVKNETAYQVDGDVYFSVQAYPSYGRLSKRKLDELLVGARVEVNERKRHPMDFALWKSSKPGEPSWKSPWGDGRPGWHIECSAMAMRHLGETFDIHGGGMDLIFPHHENEIAQSCAATGKEFARMWVHNGFVQINQEKMSKSLGNFFTIQDIFHKSEWPESETGETLRYFLLSTHYRSPVEFSDQSLHDAKSALNGFYDLFERLKEGKPVEDHGEDNPLQVMGERTRLAFMKAMADDLNTPVAIAELQKLRAEVNRSLDRLPLSRSRGSEIREMFRSMGRVLGLFQLDEWQFNPRQFRSLEVRDALPIVLQETAEAKSVVTDADIEQRLTERNEARKRKDFRRADEIRTSLAGQGITIEDLPDGTSRWKR